MRFWFATILIILLITLWFFFVFFKNAQEGAVNALPTQNSAPAVQQMPTSTAAPQTKATSGTKPNVPGGFQGPTSEPHVIGPDSPPPNY